MADCYEYFRLRASGRDAAELLKALGEQSVPRWREQGVTCWGIWRGLFGPASNELLVVAAAPGDGPVPDFPAALPPGAEVADRLSLLSTARPDSIHELPLEGLYVFRFFEVRQQDCDAIVALSRDAWESFEDTERYVSRPQGLFRPRDPAEAQGRMLLVTWYDGFDSWERSRVPAPEARDNFRQRHALTQGTFAYAARMIGKEEA